MVDAPDGPADGSTGTYVVIYHLAVPAAAVTVGKALNFDLPAGYYAYVGSAFGPGGVRARTGRHLNRNTVKKWNVDFLKPLATAVEVWWTHDPVKRECTWSGVLAESPGFSCPTPGFGSWDCNACPAHLYHSLRPPRLEDFARRLGRRVPGHSPVYRQRLDREAHRDRDYPRISGGGRRVVARP